MRRTKLKEEKMKKNTISSFNVSLKWKKNICISRKDAFKLFEFKVKIMLVMPKNKNAFKFLYLNFMLQSRFFYRVKQ